MSSRWRPSIDNGRRGLYYCGVCVQGVTEPSQSPDGGCPGTAFRGTQGASNA
jgi:hypothetical protein